MTAVLTEPPSPFHKLATEPWQPHLLSPCSFTFFILGGFFTVAGPFSSLRHHLAHHSGRPTGPCLPLLCARASLPRARTASNGVGAGRAAENRAPWEAPFPGGWRGGISAFLKQGEITFSRQNVLESRGMCLERGILTQKGIFALKTLPATLLFH